MHTFHITRMNTQGFQQYSGFIRAKNFETIRNRFYKGCEIRKGNLNGTRYYRAEFWLNGKRVGRADYMPSDLTTSAGSPQYRREVKNLQKKVSASFQVKKVKK